MKAEKVVDGTEDLKVSLEKEEALKKVQRELLTRRSQDLQSND